MGRPPLGVKAMKIRLTDEQRKRIAALVGQHRVSAWIREAVDEKLARDERWAKPAE